MAYLQPSHFPNAYIAFRNHYIAFLWEYPTYEEKRKSLFAGGFKAKQILPVSMEP